MSGALGLDAYGSDSSEDEGERERQTEKETTDTGGGEKTEELGVETRSEEGNAEEKGNDDDDDRAGTSEATPCDPAIQAKVAKFLELKRTRGRDLIEDIRNKKSFGNPDFLQKMVDHFAIEQYGSCYPRHIYDYTDVHSTDMYEKLEEQLISLEDRRRQERLKLQEEQQRYAIQFQRAGFQSQRESEGNRLQPGQKTKRKRPSGWQ